MDANVLLWIGQIVLALAFVAVGYGHAFSFDTMRVSPRMDWMTAVGYSNMRAIGLLEILGAIGLGVAFIILATLGKIGRLIGGAGRGVGRAGRRVSRRGRGQQT